MITSVRAYDSITVLSVFVSCSGGGSRVQPQYRCMCNYIMAAPEQFITFSTLLKKIHSYISHLIYSAADGARVNSRTVLLP